MIRSVLAVICGYLANQLALIAGGELLANVFGYPLGKAATTLPTTLPATLPATAPATMPTTLPALLLTTPYMAANLAAIFIAATFGGLIAGKFAGFAPRRHAAVLGGIFFVLGLMTVVGAPAEGGPPEWFRALLPLMGLIGAVLGGRLAAAGRMAQPGMPSGL